MNSYFHSSSNFDLFYQTNLGSHSVNEDSVYISEFKITFSEDDTKSYPAAITVLCDGMGGLSQGDFASQTVINHVRDAVQGSFIDLEDFDGQIIKNAIQQANDVILAHSSQTGEKVSSGTTCVVALLFPECVDGDFSGRYVVKVFSIGDSRCYILRSADSSYRSESAASLGRDVTGMAYERLTQDDSLLEFYRQQKAISKVKLPDGKQVFRVSYQDFRRDYVPAELLRLRSSLIACVGVEPLIEPRIQEITSILEPLDGILLASDGFWHRLDHVTTWCRDILEGDDVHIYLGELMRDFISQGERDNLSASVIRVRSSAAVQEVSHV